jgi:hypothetical protein
MRPPPIVTTPQRNVAVVVLGARHCWGKWRLGESEPDEQDFHLSSNGLLSDHQNPRMHATNSGTTQTTTAVRPMNCANRMGTSGTIPIDMPQDMAVKKYRSLIGLHEFDHASHLDRVCLCITYDGLSRLAVHSVSKLTQGR